MMILYNTKGAEKSYDREKCTEKKERSLGRERKNKS